MLRITSIVLIAVLTSTLHAAINIGDKPTLHLTAIDGSTIDLARHKGKLILIDFWAGRSDFNRTAEQRLVDLQTKYADKGLVIIGINCDTRMANAEQYIKDLKITWPQYWESAGWHGGIPQEWGVARIPTDFLIGPDGDVLWSGYKRNLEDFLAEQILLHPPQLVDPDVLAKANQSLDTVETALKTDDRITAVATFGRIPDETRKDPAFNKRWTKLSYQVDQAATKLLAEVDPLLASKQYSDAVAKLKDLQTKLAGTTQVPLIRKRINEILANPQAKAAVDQAQKESAAATALAAAKKLRDAGDDPSAYTHFKGVTQDYPQTTAAQQAADAVQAYEKDAKFMQKMKTDAIAAKARAALNLADNYRDNGRADLAKAKYQQIIKDFPDTSYATEAQKSLDALK
jgi:thiol-disulfide isomerase/thioredoxin/TolA-binding protein